MRLKTRERILLASLELFNDAGEPNVTTMEIADALNISPGNLYYHFKGKEEIIRELFDRFHEQFNVILRAPLQDPLAVADYWFYLVVVFEHIHAYRFLYRNLSLIMQRYEDIRKPMRRILRQTEDAALAICVHLRTTGLLDADDGEVALLARSITLAVTCWFDFDHLMGRRHDHDRALIHDGVLQVLAHIAPWLGEMRQPFMAAAWALHAASTTPQAAR